MKQRISHLTMRSNPCGNETTHTHTLRANSTPSTARERLESSIHKQDLDPSSPASQFTHRCNITSRNRTKATSRILAQIQLQAPVPACPSSPQAASRTLPQLQLQAPCQPVHPLRRQPREFFPRPSSRPVAACPSLPQADSRIPPQIKFQSQFLPVHPLRSPSQNYYPDLVLESSPACPSAPQPAFRIPSQSQFQSPT
jgi:hypothetical protein